MGEVCFWRGCILFNTYWLSLCLSDLDGRQGQETGTVRISETLFIFVGYNHRILKACQNFSLPHFIPNKIWVGLFSVSFPLFLLSLNWIIFSETLILIFYSSHPLSRSVLHSVTLPVGWNKLFQSKGKGSKSKCKKSSGISLLKISGKMFNRILIERVR